MKHSAITKHIVTAGDYAIVPKDRELFSCPTCSKGIQKYFWNGAPGQLVAFTISATTLLPISVDATNIASVTGDLYIGVFVDTDGDGAADNVRLLAGEKFDHCLVDETKVSSPTCGQPQILATYLECVKCWETYTVNFRYTDNFLKSWAQRRDDYEEVTVAYSPQCHSCDDCEPAVNKREVICNLVDLLNHEFDTSINGVAYPDRIGVTLPKPYRAVVLHNNWYSFCLSPTAGACVCDECNILDGIVSATIGGEEVTFSGNLNPADDQQTFVAQLENIAWQIECGFTEHIGPHAGFAFVTGGGPDSCCPVMLHVVTCDDDFVLTDVNGAMDVCSSAITPFPDFPANVTCVDCVSAAPDPYTPDNGLAVIIDQPKHACDCFVTKPESYPIRNGELTFIKDVGQYSPTIKATELLAPIIPENYGSWIQYLEYSQETGGRGRNYRDVNARQGWLGLPDSQSRARNAVSHATCNRSYCTYYFGHHMSRKSTTLSPAFNELKSFVHIPSTDTTTIASWETFYDALLTKSSGVCTVLGSTTCSV